MGPCFTLCCSSQRTGREEATEHGAWPLPSCLVLFWYVLPQLTLTQEMEGPPLYPALHLVLTGAHPHPAAGHKGSLGLTGYHSQGTETTAGARRSSRAAAVMLRVGVDLQRGPYQPGHLGAGVGWRGENKAQVQAGLAWVHGV